ncbi:MAG TPA: YihY/virulence factor BrkB family protein [Capillimicrobium sp.]|jgi:YihY family inner membrane protein
MTTAAAIPQTRGELEGDEAIETLREAGRVRLAVDAFIRFRAADGFSHARALAFQVTLTLLPAIIAVVGLANAIGQEELSRVVRDTIRAFAPGAVGEILTDALRQGNSAAESERGEAALTGGLVAAVIAGTSAMAQVERGANRIYGVERDRPLVRRYGTALILALTSGVLAVLSLIVLVGGAAIRDAIGDASTVNTVWRVARWPLGVALAVAAVALLFELAPRRKQPEASWLAFGAGASVVLWLAFMALLKLYVEAASGFGATYGPIAGTIGVLLWAFLTSIALFVGLALAAQLEAVRAGVPEPRIDRESNDAPAPASAVAGDGEGSDRP